MGHGAIPAARLEALFRLAGVTPAAAPAELRAAVDVTHQGPRDPHAAAMLLAGAPLRPDVDVSVASRVFAAFDAALRPQAATPTPLVAQAPAPPPDATAMPSPPNVPAPAQGPALPIAHGAPPPAPGTAAAPPRAFALAPLGDEPAAPAAQAAAVAPAPVSPTAPAAVSAPASQPVVAGPGYAIPLWMPQALATMRLAVDPEAPQRRAATPQDPHPQHAHAELRIDSEALGPVTLRVAVAGAAVSVSWKAPQAGTDRLLDDQRADLSRALVSRGLQLERAAHG